MGSTEFFSYLRLYMCKIMGCYGGFGVKETLRRMAWEIIRAMQRSEKALDISPITEDLGIGAAPKSIGALRSLENLGYNHIIDLRGERRKSDILTNSPNRMVHWVPIFDDWKEKPSELFVRLLMKINEVRSSHVAAKLYLCCGAGEHRAPLAGVLALVMMGYPFDTAMVMIQRGRPVAELLPVYVSSLEKFLETISYAREKVGGGDQFH